MKKLIDSVKEEVCGADLGGVSSVEYGPQYKDHMLKQYDIYIQTLNHNSDTRQKTNTYFLTLNTLLITALGVSFTKETPFISNGGQLSIPFIGIIFCVIWWAIMYSYKQQAIVKNKIIQCVEEYLPLSLYKAEWSILNSKDDKIKYYFPKISLLIPWVFFILYFFIIFFSI
ncbi:hypothetical protein COW81_02800 [Candidatus Campbellbacteria bacterium CG22_combo_CG10-13_8_21_14_all_36_13]|uniref:Uncharacterized protein n=1 Tax=Candidatus Campbellbacteria bacterium CG22_combo_CG10-13_8_21_14_all_36_13 TaxID=1974529 RepID=A0A2H0DZG7_9BACT|nr:MAG: hypothetical protein COW81_02800 [Candidatus Campbellbacteria bacterium CG22_combo_CG10-13_8_21_14_all_36_13]